MKIIAPYQDGPREVEVHPTPTPGLYVGKDADLPGHWLVVHRSGATVADLTDPEYAVLIATRLGGFGDWDRPAAEMLADEGLRARWERFMHRSGLACRYSAIKPGDPEALAQAESRTEALNRRGQ